jgi:lysophospholipid acyltransferase (LPLAT)-like uncharacterized protein
LTRWAIRHGHRIVRGLGATWQGRHVGREHVDRARFGRGPVLYALSHGVLLPLVFTHRHRSASVLISESRDGEIIANVIERMGFHAIRGSSTRGGGRAVIAMARTAREGHDLAITPDGPKGPRGHVAPGVAIVARRGDVPIIPVGVASTSAFRARSWDRFLVPKPFAKVWVVYGEAIDANDDAAPDRVAARLERALFEVEADAERAARATGDVAGSSRLPG